MSDGITHRWFRPPRLAAPSPQVFEYIMQSLANYRSMHMRMQQLAAGALAFARA